MNKLMITDRDKIFTKYPWVGRTLEVDCGDAQRIKIARDRGHNVWGLEGRDYKPSWMLMGIDYFVKRGFVTNIPYPDKVFDFVICPNVLNPPEGDFEKALSEICRVGRKDFFIKLSEYFDMKAWLQCLLRVGFNVTMMQRSLQGNYLVEANRYV